MGPLDQSPLSPLPAQRSSPGPAEIAAAIAVVASLIYVAKQLGQNTAMMRVNASNERVQRDFDISSSLIESREFAEVWLKGNTGFDDLDDVDKLRMIHFERRAMQRRRQSR